MGLINAEQKLNQEWLKILALARELKQMNWKQRDRPAGKEWLHRNINEVKNLTREPPKTSHLMDETGIAGEL